MLTRRDSINLWGLQMERGYQDNRWLTYKQANELGAQVRKGERGTLVVFWQKTERTEQQEDGTEKEVTGMFAKFFTVFNADQIDGLQQAKAKEFAPAMWRHEQCEQLLSDSGAKILHNGGDRAFYSVRNDSIHLPIREAFKSEDKYLATALHELGHWSGSKDRLDRDLTGGFGSESYAREELRAEIASLMIGERLQIGHDPEQHAAYVKSWIKILKDDPREIMRACSDAEKICTHLGIEAYERAPTMKLDPQLIAKGEMIAAFHNFTVDHFAPGTPQANVLGEGWGYIGSTDFEHANGRFDTQEEAYHHLGKEYPEALQSKQRMLDDMQMGMRLERELESDEAWSHIYSSVPSNIINAPLVYSEIGRNLRDGDGWAARFWPKHVREVMGAIIKDDRDASRAQDPELDQKVGFAFRNAMYSAYVDDRNGGYRSKFEEIRKDYDKDRKLSELDFMKALGRDIRTGQGVAAQQQPQPIKNMMDHAKANPFERQPQPEMEM